jgi:Glycosyltransferase family 25 (LPS biosynthesis protein)
MLYEKESPPLSGYSPRWNTPRYPNSRTRIGLIVGVAVLMLTSLGLLRHYSTTHRKTLSLDSITQSDPYEVTFDELDPVSPLPVLSNATLDFGKIYVLNLEAREDRRDEMTFIAASTGLQLEFVPGVNSQTLEKQSLPDVYGTSQVILEPGHLACFRGHANIWRKIVEDEVDTALILEDDVDWDLSIRESGPRIKEALGRITGEENAYSNSRGTFPLRAVG